MMQSGTKIIHNLVYRRYKEILRFTLEERIKREFIDEQY